jgi:hypothetical protein
VEEVSTIGLDIAKQVFHAHGADASGATVFSRRIEPRTVYLCGSWRSRSGGRSAPIATDAQPIRTPANTTRGNINIGAGCRAYLMSAMGRKPTLGQCSGWVEN